MESAERASCTVCELDGASTIHFALMIVLIVFLYNPPSPSKNRFNSRDVTDFINSFLLFNAYHECVIAGELNFPGDNWDIYSSLNIDETFLIKFWIEKAIEQTVFLPTHSP